MWVSRIKVTIIVVNASNNNSCDDKKMNKGSSLREQVYKTHYIYNMTVFRVRQIVYQFHVSSLIAWHFHTIKLIWTKCLMNLLRTLSFLCVKSTIISHFISCLHGCFACILSLNILLGIRGSVNMFFKRACGFFLSNGMPQNEVFRKFLCTLAYKFPKLQASWIAAF